MAGSDSTRGSLHILEGLEQGLFTLLEREIIQTNLFHDAVNDTAMMI